MVKNAKKRIVWLRKRDGDEEFEPEHLLVLLNDSDLDGKDFDSNNVTEQLSLPHAPEAPPSFDLQQLQRPLTRAGGGG